MPDQNSGNANTKPARPLQNGLHPVRIWMPDTAATGFDEGCKRQSKLIAELEQAQYAYDQAFWGEVSDRTGWES